MSNGIDQADPGWPDWQSRRYEMFHAKGLVAFDLFAPLAADLLTRAKRLRDRFAGRYPLILVDEAQDTNNEQWECLRLLAAKSQVVCLADPNQMIYDFLPGVGLGRVAEIRRALKPHEVDLDGENHRSPGTEIAVFARDILAAKVRGAPYKGVSRRRFGPRAKNRDAAIRSSVGILYKKILDETGQKPQSIAVIASYGLGVAVISKALQLDRPIVHQVLFDEAFALLSSRAAAFLLEPKDAQNHAEDVATLLELTGSAFRAKGNKGALERADKCFGYAASCRSGKLPRNKIVAAASNLVASARTRTLKGIPGEDWITVKLDMRRQGDDALREMASSLDYLVAFARGHRITENLSSLWVGHGSYVHARGALDAALAQDQLLSSVEQVRGIYVMNMHKCKGKQFDGVVLYRQQHHSPFLWRNEPAPYTRSRRILHVAITRARSHILILDEASSTCPIIAPHSL
jgi:DNA helicase-2/ATP-dependent DNA helicase PcrA